MGALNLPSHLKQNPQKIIHIDMDCFFAAIEELDNPKLKGKPLAVGGSPNGRGVLCTANYEARKYGVRSAMSSADALRKCPHLTFIKPRGSRYSEVGHQIREIFREVTDIIQPLSIDEAFLDVTQAEGFNGSATLIAKHLKERIKKVTGLTASAGVAPNKFLAKVASDWKKPDGLFTIAPAEAAEFASELPIGLVPGIGQVSEKRCLELGIATLGDIHHYPYSWLENHFGKFAFSLYSKSFGIDNRKVEVNNSRKSLGLEETYHQDIENFQGIEDRIPFLMEELVYRFKRYQEKYQGKNQEAPAPIKLFIKAKTAQFKGHTFERLIKHLPIKLDTALDLQQNHELFLSILKEMFKELYNRLDRQPLRLLGLGFRLATSSQEEQEKNGQLRLL